MVLDDWEKSMNHGEHGAHRELLKAFFVTFVFSVVKSVYATASKLLEFDLDLFFVVPILTAFELDVPEEDFLFCCHAIAFDQFQ